jgi:hypothetical protein
MTSPSIYASKESAMTTTTRDDTITLIVTLLAVLVMIGGM